MRWCDDFKRRWIEAYPCAFHATPEAPDPYDMLDEIARKAELPPFGRTSEASCILGLVRLLISFEAGVVTGSGHSNWISLANSFDAGGGHRALYLVRRAIEHWQPHLMERRSVQDGGRKGEEKAGSRSNGAMG